MDVLAGEMGGGGGSRSRDAELAKAMFEGSQQHRKKLKLPEMSAEVEKIKDAMLEEPFSAFFKEDPVGRFFFCRFVADVHPAQGNALLLCGRYDSTVHAKRPVAQEIVDSFMSTVTEIWSGEDPETILEAYEDGKKPAAKPGKKSDRQQEKAQKLEEAYEIHAKAVMRLQNGLPPDLVTDMFALLRDGVDEYFGAFKRSKYVDLYARARSMETNTVVEDDFHQFRVLGVGGFGSVNAALKKDTGMLLAIKRMDKKLIKHKNRYRSCMTEFEALKAITSRFICGMHYTYQTKDDVCIALDLLHGGTLSFLLHERKRVSERYVAFFTACIVMAYEALWNTTSCTAT